METYFVKKTVLELQEIGIKEAFVPVDSQLYLKTKIDECYLCDLRLKGRNYPSHKHLFKMLDFWVQHGFSEKSILVPDDSGTRTILTIRLEIINAKFIENQNDYTPTMRTLIDIIEELYNPVKFTNINGEVEIKKGSISYIEMQDEERFIAFKKKVCGLIAYNIKGNMSFEEMYDKLWTIQI